VDNGLQLQLAEDGDDRTRELELDEEQWYRMAATHIHVRQ